MKKILSILTVIAGLLVSSQVFAQNNPRKVIGPSGGGITSWNVATDLRTRSYHLGAIMVPAAGDVTAGIDGVVGKGDLYSSNVGRVVITQTSSIAAFPYPAKLKLVLIDGGAASPALTCTSITLRGFDQFGNSISETVSSISETAKLSAKVYESLTSFTTAGCDIATGSTNGDTSDDLQIAVSATIGLPFDIRSVDAIKAVCITESYAAGETQCWRGGSSDSAILFDNAGSGNRVDLALDSIDLGGDGVGTDLTGNTLADGQEIKFYLRAPSGVR